ncbi:pyocin knob domain-containing S74 family peptidase [Kluyvera sichuanensis]|uniref:pyocin knob domain-containing S74 family peptidase n=1 Tax=Kluyvera sichuanensis TaxID=2725494 RepID=UPI0034A123E1
MSAGTLKLTNGSTAVTGTGTSFTTDLTTADFVVVTVGGTTHSLAVDSVTNATALVLSAPFTGPTTASVAWQAVPRKAMLRVTAELNRQVTEALRLGNENAINWQAVLSADDTATVVLPDGTTLTGLSWKKLSEIMTDMDIDAIKPLAAQIHTDAAQVAADKPVIVQAKTDAIAAKNAAAGSQTAAAGSATAAAGSASTATTQADRAKTEADRAQSANPDNQLKKANNLSDVADKAAARTNLQVVYRSPTTLTATDNLNDFNGLKAGEYFNSQNVNAKPENNYPVSSAGSLKVYWTSASNNTGCVQEYRVYSSSRMFSRIFNGVNWTPWVEYYNSGSVVPLSAGGTGRTDGTIEAKSDQNDLIRLQPTGSNPAWIVFRDSSVTARWRVGREGANADFQFIAFNSAGTSLGTYLNISNATGEISTTKPITTTSIVTAGNLSASGSSYPNVRFYPLYTDGAVIPDTVVGGFTFFETLYSKTEPTSGVSLVRRSKTGGTMGQIAIAFPNTAGVIALQGTSGIDYKHDVTDANYSEAIARIDSLRMVNFVYNDDEQNRVRFGVIAEEVELTAPQYIKHNQEQYEDILDENGEKVGAKYRDRPSVDNNPIIMDLLGYVKDLRKEIDALRNEIKALKEE